MTKHTVTKIFAPDELRFIEVDPTWCIKEILSQEGLFYLKDVAKVLNLSNQLIKGHAEVLLGKRQSPYEKIGARLLFGKWIIRMKVFAPYYRELLYPRFQTIPQDWDANVLLSKEGIFKLYEVCQKIPFTYMQLRNKAREPKAKETYGLYQDEGTYLVDMEAFSLWLIQELQNNFQELPKSAS